MLLRSKTYLLSLLLLYPQTNAAPTEQRQWTASNGKTVNAVITAIEGDKVVMKKDDGKTVKVPIAILTQEDQDFIREHFKAEIEDAKKPKPSGAEPATDLPHPQGEVVGPIDTGEGAKYFLYLPKTLKKNQKAPLLFYTNSGGGNKANLNSITEGAELCGWIMAISVESKNQNTIDQNWDFSEKCLKHLYSTLPIDPERTFFTGNSGGGGQALANSARTKCAGAMPNVGYLPDGENPKCKHFFVITGGSDYNRYVSALANKKLGKLSTHRMHPGGHGLAPTWIMLDGMFWLHTHHLAENSKDYPGEIADFAYRSLDWLKALKEKSPERAYANTKLIAEKLETSSAFQQEFGSLITELEKNPNSKLYLEALDDIDKISKGPMAQDIRGNARMNHSDPAVVRAAEKLLKKYTGVPIIEGTLKAIISPTK